MTPDNDKPTEDQPTPANGSDEDVVTLEIRLGNVEEGVKALTEAATSGREAVRDAAEVVHEWKPAVGRIVHFTPKEEDSNGNSAPVAAIITAVHSDECVNLNLFPRDHIDCEVPLAGCVTSIQRDDEAGPYSWTVPPRT